MSGFLNDSEESDQSGTDTESEVEQSSKSNLE